MKTTRREFINTGIAVAGAVAAAPAVAQSSSEKSYTTFSTARPPYVPVKVVDTDAMPWPPSRSGGLGWNVKRLYGPEDRSGSHLTIIKVPIGGPGGTSHYHEFHEWAYWLTGDFVNNEYTDPYQRIGDFQQFREGVFLDRPPYSLHGGEPNRLDSQVGGTCLIMEEGGRSVSVIPGNPGYSDDFKNVKQWAVPRIIDTIAEMPWEPDAEHPSREGVWVKHLVDDQRGFRATLWRVTKDFEASMAADFAKPYYYEQALQFNFVLNGDLRIQTYESPGNKAESVILTKSFYCERAPMSIFGLADSGVVSEQGCVWLEVTYAKGDVIPNVPIEDKTYV